MRQPLTFATLSDLAAHLEAQLGGLGTSPALAGGWLGMAELACRRGTDGRFTLHYDPKVARQLLAHRGDYAQWDAFARIDCPTLVLRGELSEVLTPSIAERMASHAPCQVRPMPGCGHVPLLDRPEDAEILGAFLTAATAD